jgi:hypothetical protein
MQEKTVTKIYLIIPNYYTYIHCLIFIWHNHCSNNQPVQVWGVDNLVRICLEYPKPCTDLKRPLTQINI